MHPFLPTQPHDGYLPVRKEVLDRIEDFRVKYPGADIDKIVNEAIYHGLEQAEHAIKKGQKQESH